jgi:Flp pilus assembly protein TadD
MPISRRRFHLGLLSSYASLLSAQTTVPGTTRRRVALLVGNSRYSFGQPLKNALNDAEDMAAALKNCGFEVTSKSDLSRESFNRLSEGFVSSLNEGDIALFFYAGHGIQIGGANYLIPVDFNPARGEQMVSRDCIDISDLQARIEKTRVFLNILVIDACRNNPFHPDARVKGLALMEAGLGTCIALSACPGQTASDRREGRNGLFTHHLLQELSGPPAPIEQSFKRVKDKVYAASAQSQRPWLLFDLIGDFALAQADPPQPPSTAHVTVLIEEGKSEYQSGRFAEAAAAFESALRSDPNNPYICNALGAARMRIHQTSIAVDLFTRAIEKKPDYAAAYFNRGLLYSTVGDQEKDAIQDFSWAIEQDPSDPRAYAQRGKCYLAISELEPALADFNRALDLNPSDAAAWLGRGSVSYRRRQNPQAIDDLTESIALKPTAEAYALRAQVYLAAGRASEAEADRRQAAALRSR